MSLSVAQLPIVKLAAGAVIVLSAVGVGVMTGLIPGVASNDRPAPEAIAPTTEPANKQSSVAAKPVTPERVREPIRQARAVAPPACYDCGVVQSVRSVEVKGEATGVGAVAGGIAGLVIGNQIGDGRGKTLAKVAGAAGGAYAGHQIEKNARKTVQYEIAVRMQDGSYRTIIQPSSDGLSPGVRVRIVNDGVVRES